MMNLIKPLLYSVPTIVVAGLLLLVIPACDKNKVDEPDPHNEEELITTVQLEFTGKGTTRTFEFRDPDGDGGEAPGVDTIRLDTSAVYDVSIKVLNESVDPAEDLTTEIQEEKAEHLFCFTPNNVDISVSITDTDGSYPLGLESGWQTGNAGSGTVKVVLKHQPDVKDGTCDPGETDVEVNFETIIE